MKYKNNFLKGILLKSGLPFLFILLFNTHLVSQNIDVSEKLFNLSIDSSIVKMQTSKELGEKDKKIYTKNFEKISFQPLHQAISQSTALFKAEEKIEYIQYNELFFSCDSIRKIYITISSNFDRHLIIVFDGITNNQIYFGENTVHQINSVFDHFYSTSNSIDLTQTGLLFRIQINLISNKIQKVSTLYGLNINMLHLVDRMVEIMAKTNSIEIKD